MNEHPRKQKNTVKNQEKLFQSIKRITALTMILSAMLFAVVGILAVWEVFGLNSHEIVWRSLATLAIMTFTSLVVNIASRIVLHK